jgi:chromosome segregation ATPase
MRIKNLKSLIQHGRDSAKVCVVLVNEGDAVFKPEEFGPRIVIERTITSSGGTRYAISRFKEGISGVTKVLKTRMEDMVAVRDFFNIQITNPCVVLNQEVSRQFLNHSKPHDLYTYFLKATQMEQLQMQINLALQELKDLGESLAAQETKCSEVEKFYDQRFKEFEKAKLLRNLEEEILKTRSALQWSRVQSQEVELQKKKSERDKLLCKVEAIESRVNDYTGKLKSHASFARSIEKELKTIQSSLKDAKVAFDTAKVDHHKLKKDFDRHNQEQAELQNRLNSEKNQVSKIQKEIADMLQVDKSFMANQIKTARAKLDSLLEYRQVLSVEIASLESSLENIEINQNSAREHLMSIQRKRDACMEACSQIRNKVLKLKSNSRNPNSSCHDQASKVMNDQEVLF